VTINQVYRAYRVHPMLKFSPFAAKVDAIYVDSGLGNCRSFGRAPSATPDPTRADELRGRRLFNVVFFANFGKSLAHIVLLMGKRHDLIFS